MLKNPIKIMLEKLAGEDKVKIHASLKGSLWKGPDTAIYGSRSASTKRRGK
jgi:hypothetical protein